MQTVATVPNKGKFGWKYPNGTLSGALGNLQKRKSDIALTAFFMKVIIPEKFLEVKNILFSLIMTLCVAYAWVKKCYCDGFWQEENEVLDITSF